VSPSPKPAASGPQPPVSPSVAREHFLEILKAKQERVRQGPAYPAANAFTGQRDTAAAPGETESDAESPAAEASEPANSDGPASPHDRDN
jgi:hypothetical protein